MKSYYITLHDMIWYHGSIRMQYQYIFPLPWLQIKQLWLSKVQPTPCWIKTPLKHDLIVTIARLGLGWHLYWAMLHYLVSKTLTSHKQTYKVNPSLVRSLREDVSKSQTFQGQANEVGNTNSLRDPNIQIQSYLEAKTLKYYCGSPKYSLPYIST